MALQGTFILNGAPYSTLYFPGLGSFTAFSGIDNYRNKVNSTHIAGSGPLPVGKYWIVDREQGGIWSRIVTAAKDDYNRIVNGPSSSPHTDWFALYFDDCSIDDRTWVNRVARGNFRLHPGTISKGCITLKNNSDFAVLRNYLLRAPLFTVPCTRALKARGFIEVKAPAAVKAQPQNTQPQK